ncbi:hypothetical protein KUCAC02_014934%2C partial [Xyrichtys novacula]|uniref:Uncharacterized protein n=1 Tax=Xyrichtys novacula TaxID=13765 RepID=A0AAV1FLP1_XYRNO|nr:hypothetical protein KUCAC02_014934%2C partial [Xyrichtys novacula]
MAAWWQWREEDNQAPWKKRTLLNEDRPISKSITGQPFACKPSRRVTGNAGFPLSSQAEINRVVHLQTEVNFTATTLKIDDNGPGFSGSKKQEALRDSLHPSKLRRIEPILNPICTLHPRQPPNLSGTGFPCPSLADGWGGRSSPHSQQLTDPISHADTSKS